MVKADSRKTYGLPVPLGEDEGEYTDEFRASLMKSREDLRKGRIHTLKEVKKKLGVR